MSKEKKRKSESPQKRICKNKRKRSVSHENLDSTDSLGLAFRGSFECTICYTIHANAEKCYMSGCPHAFCQNCVNSMTHGKCMVCRSPVNEYFKIIKVGDLYRIEKQSVNVLKDQIVPAETNFLFLLSQTSGSNQSTDSTCQLCWIPGLLITRYTNDNNFQEETANQPRVGFLYPLRGDITIMGSNQSSSASM